MNSFGRLFNVQVFGESHGAYIGVCVDGCPPGLSLAEKDFYYDLNRRKPGARGTTTRVEEDRPEIISGLHNGFTTGSPICVLFANKKQQPSDYEHLKNKPRPGHADFVASTRFRGYNDPRGGGHFSGRLTLALVAAGVIAKKIIKSVTISATLLEAGGRKDIDSAINEALLAGDSIGGIVECKAQNIPVGWGEPFFNSVESVISHLAFAVPAIKGIEFGSGFKAASMKGSEHNDIIVSTDGKTVTNNAGGISGGLTNGNDLVYRVVVKPPSSISQSQETINLSSGQTEKLEVRGRHDACIALRTPVVIEAITAIALADFSLQVKV